MTEVASLTREPFRNRLTSWVSARIASRGGYVVLYTLLFCAVLLPVLAACLLSGKSMVRLSDGLWQQYAWFIYAGDYLRNLISCVVTGRADQIPMWDMNSGYGVDVVQSLAGTFLNPMYTISVLMPKSIGEPAFELLIICMLFASGLTFTWWCLTRISERTHVLLASIIYAWSGYSIIAFNQPSFLLMLVVAPVLLRLIDKVFERKRFVAFVLVMAWLFACSYYDAYMTCLLMVLYCLAVFFGRVDAGQPRAGRLRRLSKYFVLFVGLIALALLLAAVLVLPQVLALGDMGRLDIERTTPVLYGLAWYVRFFAGLPAHIDLGTDAYSGFCALVLPIMILLVCRRREHPALFWVFIVLTVMMLLPVAGKLMNGLQYPSDRWSWAYTLCVAYACAVLMPALLNLTSRERHVIVGVLVVYGALVCLLPTPGRSMLFAVEMIITAIVLGIVFNAEKFESLRAVLLLCGCTVFSCALSFAWYISPDYDAAAYNLLGVGKPTRLFSTYSPVSLVEAAQESGEYDPRYRYDETAYDTTYVYNSSLVGHKMAIDFYNSIYAQGVSDFHASLGLTTTEDIAFRYGSLDSRAALEALLAVRYFSIPDFESYMLPYNFLPGHAVASRTLLNDVPYTLYETERVLPLAFVYTHALSTQQYSTLDIVARQQALMQAFVREDEAEVRASTIAEDELLLDAVEREYSVSAYSGCEVQDGRIFVRNSGASIVLEFEPLADSETYLVFEGLAYQDIPYRERFSDDEWSRIGFIAQTMTRWHETFRTSTSATSIGVATSHMGRGRWGEDAAANIYLVTSDSPLYAAQHNFADNLGYSEEGISGVKLTFDAPGIYSFDSLRVVAQPMTHFDEMLSALADNASTDVTLTENRIDVDVDAADTGELFVSVAYGDGWSATVDDEPVAIERANLGFMAVPISAGAHTVTFTYQTPGLVIGAWMSLVGLVCVVALAVYALRGKKRSSRA